MGIQKLVKELKKLNPNVAMLIDEDSYPTIIVAKCQSCEELKLPEGYDYNEKNGLTNKHHTTSGMCENFVLMTEYEYLAMLA